MRKKCELCGKEFYCKIDKRKYCCDNHKIKAWRKKHAKNAKHKDGGDKRLAE